MMNKYKIIQDEKALEEFIDWLPELEANQTYYLSLFARKKYASELIQSNDKTQLKRFVSDKRRMISKIKKLEVEYGLYDLNGRIVPQESLVLYIHPTPRCQTKAAKLMAKKCLDLVFDNNKGYNIVTEALSCIQKAKSKSKIVHFDIDTKDIDLTLLEEYFPTFINRDIVLRKEIIEEVKPYTLVETRGGYHLLVDTSLIEKYNFKVYANPLKFKRGNIPGNWWQWITNTYPVEQSGDLMLPVVGACQGGFVPKFV